MCKFIQNQHICFVLVFLILFFPAKPCMAEFTIEDEKKLGKEFYEKLNEQKLILKDQTLNDYVTKIGMLILAQTQKAPFDFRFFIVDSNAINAFATPGGYIYINKGLILAVDNEAELAGVIAHEIGHANARHIASIISKSQKLTMATLAAILAGAFLGGGGETSAAIAAFSIAGSSSLTLKYMREHEEEADRLGLSYLTAAGYYPAAIIDFLKIMKQSEFISKSMPSYLMTHPGTDNRIIYMDALIATQYRQQGVKNIIGNISRIQAYIPLDILELSKKNKQLENALKNDPDNADLLYGLAAVEDRLGQTESSLQHYQKALSLSPDDDDILKNMGLIYLKTGKADMAEEYLQRAVILNAKNDENRLALGKAYFARGKYRNALDCFLSINDKKTGSSDMNYLLAMTYGKLNNQGESHYYFGLHFMQEKKRESALFHFNEALNYIPQNPERTAEINRFIKELKGVKRERPAGKPAR